MNNFFPVGKPNAKTIYATKEACEAAEGQACYDITGVDLETHDLVDAPLLDGQGQPMFEQIPVLDENQQPVLDENGQPTYSQGPQIMQKVFQLNAQKAAAKAAVQAQVQKVRNRTDDRIFCLGIIDEIAAINEDLNDPQLMAAIVSNANFVAIILMLLTGGLKTARALMVAHGPSLYPQATVDAFVAKMDAQIASQQ